MTNVSMGMSGFSDRRMSDPQREEEHERLKLDAQAPIIGDLPNLGIPTVTSGKPSAKVFRQRFQDAIFDQCPAQRREGADPDTAMSLLASSELRPTSADPVHDLGSTTEGRSHGRVMIERISRIIHQQLQAHRSNGSATSIRLRLPNLPNELDASVELTLDDEYLDVVLLYVPTQTPDALVAAADDLKRSLMLRMPSRRVRVYARFCETSSSEDGAGGFSVISRLLTRDEPQ